MEQLSIALGFFTHSPLRHWPGLAIYFFGWGLFRVTGIRLFRERKISLKHFSAVGDVEGNCGFNFLYEIAIRNSYDYKDFLVRPDVKVAFDAGANCGFFSLLYLSQNSGARAYSFEPHPVTANRLRKNIAANNLEKRLTLIEAAIGSQSGECMLNISNQSSMASVSGSAHKIFENPEQVKVKIISLDDFARDLGTFPDLMKIDVEGFEVEALKGAVKCLAHAKYVILEFHNADLREQCLSILKAAGFSAEVYTTLIFARKAAAGV